MTLEAYINFNGNCREAVEYYAEVFGTEKPQFMLYKDVPDEAFPVTEETKDMILHTSLDIAGSTVMFSDVPPDMPFVTGNNISLVIISKDMNEIRSMFDKLKNGGSVDMDLQETFWSKLHGFVTDKFGVGWQFSHESE
ncbi:VOC family protein [Methanolobus sp. ZRKC2]|uniref:VOC family protein n=1 Tax=Methanolobus sp. ZRKC2 TaxID=3125783 RepID=UPI0032460B48